MPIRYIWTWPSPTGDVRVEYEPLGGTFWASAQGRLFIGDRLADQRNGAWNGVRLSDASTSTTVELRRAYGAAHGWRTPASLIALSVAGAVQRPLLIASPWLSQRSRFTRLAIIVLMLLVNGRISTMLEKAYPRLDALPFSGMLFLLLFNVPFLLAARFATQAGNGTDP